MARAEYSATLRDPVTRDPMARELEVRQPHTLVRLAIPFAVMSFAACSHAGVRSLVVPAKADSAMYVVTLGPDTSYVEWLVIDGNDLRMQVVERIPRVRYLSATATLNGDGSISKLERLAYLPASTDTSPVERVTVQLVGDSTIFETTTRTTSSRYTSAGHVHLVVGPYNGVGLPVLAHYAPAGLGDSVMSTHMGGIFGNRTLKIKRIANDSLSVSSRHLGSVRVHVGPGGRSAGFNAVASSLNTTGVRASWLPIDSVRSAFEATERIKGAAGVASPRDSVRASIGGAKLTVDYGRPSKRGRRIFGGIIPYNQVWRTGANAATHFTTDRTLHFGGNDLPPGRYTFWTLPAPDGWTFIVNNQTDQWGTEYDPTFDRFRMPLKLSTLPQPREKFTIVLDPTEVGGVLRFQWDTVDVSVPFTVAR